MSVNMTTVMEAYERAVKSVDADEAPALEAFYMLVANVVEPTKPAEIKRAAKMITNLRETGLLTDPHNDFEEVLLMHYLLVNRHKKNYRKMVYWDDLGRYTSKIQETIFQS